MILLLHTIFMLMRESRLDDCKRPIADKPYLARGQYSDTCHNAGYGTVRSLTSIPVDRAQIRKGRKGEMQAGNYCNFAVYGMLKPDHTLLLDLVVPYRNVK